MFLEILNVGNTISNEKKITVIDKSFEVIFSIDRYYILKKTIVQTFKLLFNTTDKHESKCGKCKINEKCYNNTEGFTDGFKCHKFQFPLQSVNCSLFKK